MGGGGGEITKPPGKASAERCRGISCPDFFAAQQSASLQAVRAEEAGLLQADLPVSDNLIAFNTSQGAELLLDNPKELSSYFLMAQHSVMQITQTFCGVATACGQLNSLAGLAAPVDPTYKPYPYFTQAGYFSECVEAVVPEATVRVMGMTLEQWGAAARCWGAEARVVHGSSSSVDTFRDDARQALAGGKQVAVNFYRGGLEQAGGGHFSPLGAYSSSEDRFLLMDVARYKYPMVWVKTAELFDAMNTTDSDAGMSRGYAIVGAREAQGLDIQVGCSAAASR